MTTAFVLAVPGSWDWVGSRPLLTWLIRKLMTVRGIDRVVILANGEQNEEELRDGGTEIPIISVADAVEPGWAAAKVVATVDAGKDSDVAVLVHGGYCCLDPGTVERALSAVINEGQPAAISVRRYDDAVMATGPRRRIAVVVETPALLVARRDAIGVTNAVPAYVEIEEHEALDATTPHGAALIRAMAEQGDF